jgi:hypothetical protein
MNHLKPKQTATKLTVKQQLFVNEYMKDGNGTRAAEAAGYKSPTSMGSQLANGMTCPLVKIEIDRRLKEHEQSAVQWQRTNNELLQHIHTILFFNPLEYFEPSDDGSWLIDRERFMLIPKTILCMIDRMTYVTRVKEVEAKNGSKTRVVTKMVKVDLVSKTVALTLAAKHQLPMPGRTLDVNVSMPDWDKLHKVKVEDAEFKVVRAGDPVEEMIREAKTLPAPSTNGGYKEH